MASDHMVSPKMRRGVKRCYEALLAESLEIHRYSGTVFDVAFQIITAETFVAGVATKILDREVVSPEEAAVIKNPLVLEGSLWRCDDGQTFDLKPFPQVHRTAIRVESLRAKCYDALDCSQ
jgi:hypothetical protein